MAASVVVVVGSNSGGKCDSDSSIGANSYGNSSLIKVKETKTNIVLVIVVVLVK